ncbi:deoxycytidine triphosphate deaminase [Streptomyces sp. NPDC048644]|uniref:dCTP deaminase n=1 Tax=Streptomyces sp. NPDC048644 TaxID=3365582 RepID=UPI003713346E
MILTRRAIGRAVAEGDIVIDPFDPERLSPNAYDWRLGDRIRICDGTLDAASTTSYREVSLGTDGYVLKPGRLYLGVTHERTASERFAQLINGDRTVGGLGIWVHISAPLGHVGHAIHWTLEMRVAQPVRIYPYMTFGKIVFLDTFGEQVSYQNLGSKYTSTGGIDISRLHEELS